MSTIKPFRVQESSLSCGIVNLTNFPHWSNPDEKEELIKQLDRVIRNEQINEEISAICCLTTKQQSNWGWVLSQRGFDLIHETYNPNSGNMNYIYMTSIDKDEYEEHEDGW